MHFPHFQHKIMKLLLGLACAVSVSAVEYECFLGCYRDYMRSFFKCDNEHAIGSDKHQACMDDATRQFFHGCVGAVCGGNIPDGTCDNRCTPVFHEEAAICEEMYDEGEISLGGFKFCMEKPDGPIDHWEKCFVDCTCQMPWCSCTPPEEGSATTTTAVVHKFNFLRNFEMTCYHDEE